MRYLVQNQLFIVIVSATTLLFVHCSTADETDVALPDTVDFNFHVRPILSQNCYVCHGPDSSSRQANLRLDTREGATTLLESGGRAIRPGKPHKSDLITRVSSTDPELRMPPPEAKKVLSNYEVAILKKWIDQGAEWKPHWSFIAPSLPASIENTDSPVTAVVDQLLQIRLTEKELVTSPPATANALVRRVAYLLTGLPPTVEELQQFKQCDQTDIYNRMVDYYLQSDHFGERWARHWMDLTRYAEYRGHEFDYPITGAWQYRDYLIRAFNQDVPYPQMVKEHLAGDLIEPRLHPTKGFNESIIGTAYFTLGEGKHSPVDTKAEEAAWADNVIDVTSKTFQGLTVSCAKCHDHKFDPIPTTDYYAMYGMIESTRITPLPLSDLMVQQRLIDTVSYLQNQFVQRAVEQIKALAMDENQVRMQQEFMIEREDPIAQIIDDAQDNTSPNDLVVVGDFREGEWSGWSADGQAFGKRPIIGIPLHDLGDTPLQFTTGYASSRYYASGLTGALRSSTFKLTQDSVLVRARGHNGLIRIIVDNFQLIQNPLYGSFEKKVNSKEWKDYHLDVTLLKGHKAYIEFLPGTYVKHEYTRTPDDYIEAAFAFAFDSLRIPSISKSSLTVDHTQLDDAVTNLQNENLNVEQISILNAWAEQKNIKLNRQFVNEFQQDWSELAAGLIDSVHFLGVADGDAVFSPVFIRGDLNQLSSEKVSHRFLDIMADDDNYTQKGSGRLEFAKAIVDPENPLTYRVMVNRIWHHLFGRGIVTSVDNFGLQGTLPSHPVLLDFLALKFQEEGGSIKQMIRHLVKTEAFKRSTTPMEENHIIDPQNIFLHHYPLRRLEGEAVRDGILATAGTLDTLILGAPVSLHLTDFMTGRGRPAKSGPLDGDGRRSIYTEIRRNFLPPMLLTFDMPIPFSSFGKRNTTNVPAQSLALLNDPFVHDQAAKMAEMIASKSALSMDEKIQMIFLRAMSREATEEEVLQAKELLKEIAKKQQLPYTENSESVDIWREFCHAVFNMKEFIYLL